MFKEKEHPRDDLGRFTDKNNLTESKTKELSAKYEDVFPQEKISTKAKNKTDFFGVEHKGVKGNAAIEKLLREKQGHVKNAFYRKEIGGMDLVWGDEKGGLMHVIKRRDIMKSQGTGTIGGIEMVKKNSRHSREWRV